MPPRLRILGTVFVGIACVVASAARADFLYKPWDVNAEAIRQTMRRSVPQAFLVPGRTVYIETVSAEEMHAVVKLHYPQSLDVLDTLRGLYLPRPKDGPANLPENGSMILMSDLKDKEQYGRSLAHEYGHFVYCELCTEDEKGRWQEIWRRQARRKTLPTAYAAENALEGFAETFRLYAMERSALPAESVAFFDKLGARLASLRR
jgi:hypothetical protein